MPNRSAAFLTWGVDMSTMMQRLRKTARRRSRFSWWGLCLLVTITALLPMCQPPRTAGAEHDGPTIYIIQVVVFLPYALILWWCYRGIIRDFVITPRRAGRKTKPEPSPVIAPPSEDQRRRPRKHRRGWPKQGPPWWSPPGTLRFP